MLHCTGAWSGFNCPHIPILKIALLGKYTVHNCVQCGKIFGRFHEICQKFASTVQGEGTWLARLEGNR